MIKILWEAQICLHIKSWLFYPNSHQETSKINHFIEFTIRNKSKKENSGTKKIGTKTTSNFKCIFKTLLGYFAAKFSIICFVAVRISLGTGSISLVLSQLGKITKGWVLQLKDHLCLEITSPLKAHSVLSAFFMRSSNKPSDK